MNYEQLKECENNFIQELLDFFVQDFSVSGATIFNVDEKRRKIIFKSISGTTAETLIESKMVYGEGVVGHAVKSGASIFTNNVNEDVRFNKSYDRKTGFETQKLLASPVKTEDNIIAAIELINKENGDFTEADVQKLEQYIQELSRKIEKKLYELS